MKPSTTGPLPIASAKTWSLLGSFSTSSRSARESVGLRPVAQRVGRRHAVGLGEHHVEADRRRAARGELVDELGKHGARPRPLPDLLQQLLVDIDDAHRQSRIERARVEPLIGVEDERPQPRDRRRVPDTQGKRSQDDHPDNEDIEETRTHPVACHALWIARRSGARWQTLANGAVPLQCHVRVMTEARKRKAHSENILAQRAASGRGGGSGAQRRSRCRPGLDQAAPDAAAAGYSAAECSVGSCRPASRGGAA